MDDIVFDAGGMKSGSVSLHHLYLRMAENQLIEEMHFQRQVQVQPQPQEQQAQGQDQTSTYDLISTTFINLGICLYENPYEFRLLPLEEEDSTKLDLRQLCSTIEMQNHIKKSME